MGAVVVLLRNAYNDYRKPLPKTLEGNTSMKAEAYTDYDEWVAAVEKRKLEASGTGFGEVYAVDRSLHWFGDGAPRMFYGSYNHSIGLGFLAEEGVLH